jgi:hypothetical protein
MKGRTSGGWQRSKVFDNPVFQRHSNHSAQPSAALSKENDIVREAVNLYRAPDAPVADDFIVVEPRRRPTSNVVAAVSCFAFATFLIIIEAFTVYLLIAIPPSGPSSFISWKGLILVPLIVSPVVSLIAGRSFWQMQDRKGLILFLVALGAFASVFLFPLLFP